MNISIKIHKDPFIYSTLSSNMQPWTQPLHAEAIPHGLPHMLPGAFGIPSDPESVHQNHGMKMGLPKNIRSIYKIPSGK